MVEVSAIAFWRRGGRTRRGISKEINAYLFVAMRWAETVELDLSGCANLQAFQKPVAARPAVQAAKKGWCARAT